MYAGLETNNLPEQQTLTIQQAIDLGVEHHNAGRLPEAENVYNQILQAEPDQPVALHLLGVIAHQVGKNDIAVDLISKALAIKPDYAEAHSNLGLTLQDLGKLDEAVASYNKALAIKPDFAEAHSNLGLTLQEMGRRDEAFKCNRRAVTLDPENNLLWAGLAQSITGFSFTSVDDDIWEVLLNLIERPTVRPASVVGPVISALQCHPSFLQVLKLTSQKKRAVDFAYGDAAAQLSAIPLLLRIMELAPISDLKIERMLTFLRRAMLAGTMSGKFEDNGMPFAAALALQCFTNEYIYPETEAETADVKKLEQQVEALVEKKLDVAPFIVAALGAYRPLHAYSWSQELRDREWGDDIKDVVERQISEPLEEQSLRSQIIFLTPIKDTVSNSVREQYEENPYPRWVKTGLSHKGESIRGDLQGAPLQFDLGDYTSPEKPEILIAGCGTGQHALTTASRFKGAHVLAVDLSLSSLSYAMRKTNELALTNIEYAQADIMELSSLDRQFDLIESVGVLHHLGEPLTGWRILVDLLRPGGLMKIGLYSETARQHIVESRSLIAEKGYASSPEDIGRCRQEFIEMAEGGNEGIKKIAGSQDFYSLSACRDLLFHVQEHRFTLPQIKSSLKSLKLEFLGFEMENQDTMRKFKETNPKKGALTSLSLWNKFELKNPDTFIGMYQFWCQKM